MTIALNTSGLTPLQYAAAAGNAATCRLHSPHCCLLQPTPVCRAMASALDTSGLTPLHYAAAADDAATCRLLLRCGAPLLAMSSAPCYDPQLPCNAGSTVLHVAAMHNAVKAADAILTEWVGVGDGLQGWGIRKRELCTLQQTELSCSKALPCCRHA